ncbi:MAG: hypothetical protein CENE_02178 [Candidatus Celerinatantimonas neptuna]|nr:MAG: hypothetical protein CENE_02178 [Candidatus Celerinatantimonas neptuna]
MRLLSVSSGFTLIEMMISISLSVLLFLGGYHVYFEYIHQNMVIHQLADIQLRGEAALQLLTDNIREAGFWGELTPLPVSAVQWRLPAVRYYCDISSLNHVDYPSKSKWPLPLIVSDVPLGYRKRGCVGSARVPLVAHSLIVSVLHLSGPYSRDRSSIVHLKTFLKRGMFTTQQNNLSTSSKGQLWRYQHQWFFITRNKQVPELRRVYLSNKGIEGENQGAIVKGIERIEARLAVCRKGRLIWLQVKQLSDDDWSRLVALHLGLLVRALHPDSGYINDHLYQIAGVKVGRFHDHYRRLSMEQVSWLANMAEHTKCEI